MGTPSIKISLTEPQLHTHYIAIVSTASSYRLCWLFQQQEGLLLTAAPQPVTAPGPDGETATFPTFFQQNEQGLCWLVANRSPHGPLIKELSEADYMLRIDGLDADSACRSLIQRIRTWPAVTMAAEITDRRIINKLKKL